MSSRPFNPLPTFPIPIQWDVPGRIAQLRAMIDDPATSQAQKINLQVAINLYHSKELPGRFKYIQNGKVVSLKDINFKQPYWVEGYGQQLSSRATIPATVPGLSSAPSQPVCNPSSQQLAHHMIYNTYAEGTGGHEIFARIRPIPGLLSSSLSITVTMLNDTGSDVLTVFDTDLTALAIPPTYEGFGTYVSVSTPNGIIIRQQVIVDIQLLDSQGNPVSDWIREEGVITPAALGVGRLSGDGIRQSLYFATAPGNQHLEGSNPLESYHLGYEGWALAYEQRLLLSFTNASLTAINTYFRGPFAPNPTSRTLDEALRDMIPTHRDDVDGLRWSLDKRGQEKNPCEISSLDYAVVCFPGGKGGGWPCEAIFRGTQVLLGASRV
ncbi:uncharacterized protein BDCG_16552 [Blastomyces dermatitidis ER-3]|uniref:Uncharacterized protein n=1 Tax=Ajellomyces dermatitidis (strain ER-3 / ATCC MYA-2586) TaxID=559297 RepID=A0ABX2VSR6_AJEDR|nr:uncharacterized protein BDCG_16552 [Blastomyces dermatitidis ER-3]OAT00265.1 hypothetical protein BDCG_16552 [Blastomyces dermatitidis ER-3]